MESRFLLKSKPGFFSIPLFQGEDMGDLEDMDGFGVDGWLYFLSCLDIWFSYLLSSILVSRMGWSGFFAFMGLCCGVGPLGEGALESRLVGVPGDFRLVFGESMVCLGHTRVSIGEDGHGGLSRCVAYLVVVVPMLGVWQIEDVCMIVA